MRRSSVLVRALLGVLAVLMLSGCGGEDPQAAGNGAVTVGLGMGDNFFTRDVTRVAVGDTVKFDNGGETVHNAVAVDGSWKTSEDPNGDPMQPGDSVRLTFYDPGVYEFYCTFHATKNPEGKYLGMAGTLIVGDVPYQANAGTEPIDPVTEWTGVTRRVPQDHPDIQNAVDAADPGDLVLIDEGTYNEQVNVTTPYLTIRGVDRAKVIVDGQFQRPNGINVAAADGVAVENLTVQNTTINGVFFTGLTGYRTSYVTSKNAGVYGIYAFDATDGLIEHSYASGSPDAGIYIGQCDPCNAVVTDVVAEWNGLGYSGTNASGNLLLVNSIYRHNAGGITPNTLDTELLPPVHDVTIVGNLSHDNDNRLAPALTGAYGAFGTGISIAGGNDGLIARNRVFNHSRTGIFISPNSSRRFWMSAGNTVRDNDVSGSGIADITFSGPAMEDNCFEGNTVTSTVPVGLQEFYGCSGLRLPMRMELGQAAVSLGWVAEAEAGNKPPRDAWKTAPAPTADAQPQMPGGADAPVDIAYNVFTRNRPDLDAIALPSMPSDLEVTQGKVFTLSGVPLFASAFGTFYGLYVYILPFALFASWIALAAWDISRRDDLSKAAGVGWLAVILLVPFLGAVAYYFASRSPIPGHIRGMLVGGGFVAYVALFAVGAVIGGVV